MIEYQAKLIISFSEMKRGMKTTLKNVARRIHDALNEFQNEWPKELRYSIFNTHGSMYWSEKPPCLTFSYDYDENNVGDIDEKFGNLMNQDEINQAIHLFEKWMEQGKEKLKEITEEEMKKYEITFSIHKKILK